MHATSAVHTAHGTHVAVVVLLEVFAGEVEAKVVVVIVLLLVMLKLAGRSVDRAGAARWSTGEAEVVLCCCSVHAHHGTRRAMRRRRAGGHHGGQLVWKKRERKRKRKNGGARVQDTGADKKTSLFAYVFQTDVKLHNAIV